MRYGAHICNPSTPEMEGGRLRVQDHPQIHSELGARLGYMSPWPQNNRKRLETQIRCPYSKKKKKKLSPGLGTGGVYGSVVKHLPNKQVKGMGSI